MLSFLFWNLNGNNAAASAEVMLNRIRRLTSHFSIDVFVFVESSFDPNDVVQTLCSALEGEYCHSPNECPRIQCFHRLSALDVVDQFSSPDERLAIRRLFVRPKEILLVSLHAPSQLHLSTSEIKDAINDYRTYITDTEKLLSLRRTIVVGDMNLNPFDEGLVSAHGFHAVMTKAIARRSGRKVYGVRRSYFYNPDVGVVRRSKA